MSEAKRGCGYRKVGALYLCGEYTFVSCDRLPYELKSCPVCGAGIHFTRSMTEVNPLKLFGLHDATPVEELRESQPIFLTCNCPPHCVMCYPTNEPAFIKTIGKKYYSPESFMKEARTMGVSLRMAQIPKNLKLGKTVIYLAHPEACLVKGNNAKLIEKRLGIFSAFIPQRVEMPVYDKMLKGKGSRKLKATLKKRGITPVVVKGKEHDPNYKPRKKRKVG